MQKEKFIRLILDNEDVLIYKALNYAKEHSYTKYTSTLKEAWRISINGLSKALIKVIENNLDIPELGPDEDYTKNELAEFGIIEAQRHRCRGVTLSMFLGLMKYYQQSYIDIISESDFSPEDKSYYCQYIKRYFDHVELGFTVEWAGLSEKQKLEELQETNRQITNEKNRYLTVFESIYDPIILIDNNYNIENINYQAAEIFLGIYTPGTKYYSKINTDNEFDWLIKKVKGFIDLNIDELLFEETLATKEGPMTFIIKFKKMLDVSEKFRGIVVIFSDITERKSIEKELKKQQEKLESYAYSDLMTGLASRRRGIMILEEQMAYRPFAICYLDIDGLKLVNDTYGHTEGDSMIYLIAFAIRTSVRDIDTASRMGGDEFLIIFPGYSKDEAGNVVEKITAKLDEYDKKQEKPFKHSFSYGIVEITNDCESNIDEIIKAADVEMYKQKLLKYKLGNRNTI